MMGSVESKKMIAIINSMTPKERTHTKLIKGSRKNRIARGSGNGPQDVNKLLKQFEKMQKGGGFFPSGPVFCPPISWCPEHI
jgi:signal recognition particle subunit SRP54